MSREITPAAMPGEYYFKEGCYIEELLNSDMHEALSIARVRVVGHTATRPHALLDTIERYVILSGEGYVTVAHETWKVEAKDVVIIAAQQLQKIENRSDKDLVFLAICTPRFRLENYQEL